VLMIYLFSNTFFSSLIYKSGIVLAFIQLCNLKCLEKPSPQNGSHGSIGQTQGICGHGCCCHHV
uniref:Uncharacterized protein n=1 Tax=Periophthalmus magnuspinnatus TaxID=409849 RepID=A0A3B4BJT3_9GOBI